MDYFTSDLHWGHRLMIDESRYESPHRVRTSMEDHDAAIIAAINQRVKPEDTLYIIGDLSFHKPPQTASNLREINCKKVKVKGNHDHREKNRMGAMLPAAVMLELDEFHHYLERKFTVEPEGPGQLVCMFHFPIMHWHKQHYGSWHLHGHLHGNPSGVPGKALDVGWDKWGKPLSIMEVKAEMDKLPERANHHEALVDYEKLLKWYIKHVGECEGINFLGDGYLGCSWGNTAPLTEAEKAALLEAAE